MPVLKNKPSYSQTHLNLKTAYLDDFMKNTSGEVRTRLTRRIQGLEIELSLPFEMDFQRSFTHAVKSEFCYSGISLSKTIGDKVSFKVRKDEVLAHFKAYTLEIKEVNGQKTAYLHFFYRR